MLHITSTTSIFYCNGAFNINVTNTVIRINYWILTSDTSCDMPSPAAKDSLLSSANQAWDCIDCHGLGATLLVFVMLFT